MFKVGDKVRVISRSLFLDPPLGYETYIISINSERMVKIAYDEFHSGVYNLFNSEIQLIIEAPKEEIKTEADYYKWLAGDRV